VFTAADCTISKTFAQNFVKYLERRREELETWKILKNAIVNKEKELRKIQENTGLPRK